MASGILGGGALQASTQTPAYTTPSGKTTTTSLLLLSGGLEGTVSLSFGSSVIITVNVPAGGIMTLSGIILAAGQGVSLITYTSGISYLLTGWESTP